DCLTGIRVGEQPRAGGPAKNLLDGPVEPLAEERDAQQLTVLRVPLPSQVQVLHQCADEVWVAANVLRADHVAELYRGELPVLGPRQGARRGEAQVLVVRERIVERQ